MRWDAEREMRWDAERCSDDSVVKKCRDIIVERQQRKGRP